MRALLEKDLRLIFGRKTSLLIFLTIGLVFTYSFGETMGGAYMTMLGALLSLGTMSYDQMDQCMPFLLTLPNTRKQYVIEKYIFVYGCSMIAGIIGIFAIVIMNAAKGIPSGGTMCMEILITEFYVAFLTGGLMIPLELKFGIEKAKLIILLVFGGIAAAGYLVDALVPAGGLLDNLAVKTDQMNPAAAAASLLIIAVFLSVISFLISVKILERKEF